MMRHEVGLEILGEKEANLNDVIRAGRKFISVLYNDKHSTTSMNQLRHTIFISKTNTPKIKTLPPTDSALDEHLNRAHLQTMVWKAADQLEPPDLNIANLGWDVITGIPKPCTWVFEVAPPELMKVAAYGCSAENACSRNNCSCRVAGLSCTSFCKCTTQDCCSNPHTKNDANDSGGENEESDED